MHLGKKVINLRFSIQHDPLVCYTAVFSVVTERSSPLGGALRDDTKNGWVADYMIPLPIPATQCTIRVAAHDVVHEVKLCHWPLVDWVDCVANKQTLNQDGGFCEGLKLALILP